MNQSKLLQKIAILVLLAVTLVAATGASFTQSGSAIFVDAQAGSDSNSGTSTGSAFRTIQKAVNSANPGSTIYVRGGTYNENIILNRSGSSTAPITLTRYGNEVVTINGGSEIAIRSQGQVSYWVLDGLTVRSSNRYTLRFGWWGEPMTDHFTVKNNTLFGANFLMGSYHLWENNNISGVGYNGTDGDAGISDAGDSHHNVYRSNTVHDFSSYNARGIWTQGLTHDSLIENNVITNINSPTGLGQCIDLDGASNVEWRHIVRGNRVSGCSYVGIQLENVFDSVVENNIIDGGTAGMIVISYDSGVGCKNGGESGQYGDQNGDNNCQGDPTNNVVRQNLIKTSSNWGWGYGGVVNWFAGATNYWGNTIISSNPAANGGINIQGTAAQNRNISIKNNIISQGSGAAICSSDLGSIAEDTNNMLYRSGSGKVYTSGSSCSQDYSLAEYQAATGKGQNNLTDNPNFTGSGDYTLSSSSPAIDTGVGIGTTSDLLGNSRPANVNYDMGAFEYTGSVAVPTAVPTIAPTAVPTAVPTIAPTAVPTAVPTLVPTSLPTTAPTAVATTEPTSIPTTIPPTAASGSPSGSNGVGAGTYDDTSSAVAFSGSWTTYKMSGPYNKTFHTTTKTGSSAELAFYGNSVSLLYTAYTNRGTATIYIDGSQAATINAYSRKLKWQQQWTSPVLADGNHTISVVFSGGQKYFDVDAFIVSGAPANTPTSTAKPVSTNTSIPTAVPTNTTAPTATFTSVPTSVPTNTSVPTSVPTALPTNTTVPTSVPTLVQESAQQTSEMNLGLGKTAIQSSVYGDAVASRAVDGNTNGDFYKNSVTHTKDDPQPWWQVDLGSVYQINSVNLWTRTDCCDYRNNNVYVLVSDTPFLSNDLNQSLGQTGVSGYSINASGSRPAVVAANRTGRYIRVQLPIREYLSLAEVQVMGLASPVPTQAPAIPTLAPLPTSVPTMVPTTVPTEAPTAEPTAEPAPTQEPALTEPPVVASPASEINLAVNKLAFQSSTYADAAASRAADGNTDGNYYNNSVSHTMDDPQAWWQVDLGGVHQINTINVWTRGDCCEWRSNNVYILVSDAPILSGDLTQAMNQPGVSSYLISGYVARPSTVAINRTGQYVRVQLTGRDFLSLAEVEVMGLPGVISTQAPSSELTAAPTDPPAAQMSYEPTPEPASQPAQSSLDTSSVVKVAWFYNAPYQENYETVASKFNSFFLSIDGREFRDVVRSKGNTNPMVFYYVFNAIFDMGSCEAEPNLNQAAYLPGDFCAISEQHPDWFLLDTAGNRIQEDFGNGKYLVYMDPSNPGWREFWLQRARNIVESQGWNGVFMDNMDGSLDRFRRINQMPANYPDDNAMQSAYADFAAYAYQSYFNPNGLKLFANITETIWRDTGWMRYLDNLDGMMDEGFGVDWGSGYFSREHWEFQLGNLESLQNSGKEIIYVAQGDGGDQARQEFAFGSYMLVANGVSSFRYTQTGSYVQPWIYDNYSIALGSPQGARYQDGENWVRDFANGKLIVNPDTHAVTFALNQ